MKTKAITLLTTALAFSVLSAPAQANTSYQDAELENVKQQLLLIEKAERTGDPALVAQADKVKADLITQEAKANAKNPISMEDKIIIIEQAKMSDSSDIKEVAETIKNEMLLDDTDNADDADNTDDGDNTDDANNTDDTKAKIKVMAIDNDDGIGLFHVFLGWLSGAVSALILMVKFR